MEELMNSLHTIISEDLEERKLSSYHKVGLLYCKRCDQKTPEKYCSHTPKDNDDYHDLLFTFVEHCEKMHDYNPLTRTPTLHVYYDFFHNSFHVRDLTFYYERF